MTYISNRSWEHEVSAGRVSGASWVLIRGHNPDIDSAASEDIWEGGGTLSYLTSAETMDIVSTSASDDFSPAGTGAQTVLVAGVDGTWAAVSETVQLNGITNVTTSNSYLRVNSMTVLTAGSAGHNVGNITATASTAATLQCEMDATESLSMNSHYTVPLNKKGFLYRVEFNAAKISGGGNPVIEFKGYGRTNTGPWYQLFDKKMDTAVVDELDVVVVSRSSFAEKTDIRLHASTDSNNTEVRTRMYIVLEDA
jgi:hypothetical protein